MTFQPSYYEQASMKQAERRIRAILFDLDDTLIDWANPSITFDEYYAAHVNRLYNYIQGLGHTLPPYEDFLQTLKQANMDTWEEARQTWSIKSYEHILRDSLDVIGLDISELDVRESLNAIGWDPWPGVDVYPDTISVLEELQRRKYKIGLLTNSFLPMWMRDRELQAYNLLDYFDARLTAADIGYVKPHPQIYHALMDRLDITSEQAVFVGDRPKNDIAGANAVGIVSILMDPPHLNRDLDGVVPDYKISYLSELLPILDELQRR